MGEVMNIKPAMIYFPGKSLVTFWGYIDLGCQGTEIKSSPTRGFYYITKGVAGEILAGALLISRITLFLLNNKKIR